MELEFVKSAKKKHFILFETLIMFVLILFLIYIYLKNSETFIFPHLKFEQNNKISENKKTKKKIQIVPMCLCLLPPVSPLKITTWTTKNLKTTSPWGETKELTTKSTLFQLFYINCITFINLINSYFFFVSKIVFNS